MPTYDYRCGKCGEDLEVYQTFSEAPLTRHKGCGGKLTKVLSPAGIVLKGSGFYRNDSRGSGKPNGKGAADSDGGKDASTKTTETRGSESSSSGSGDAKPSGAGSSSDAKKPAAKSA